MSFPPYTEYKDSGVEWLAQVPAHWDRAGPDCLDSFSLLLSDLSALLFV